MYESGWLRRILVATSTREGSTLHLVPHHPPLARHDARTRSIGNEPLSAADTDRFARELLSTAECAELDARHRFNTVVSVAHAGVFGVHAYRAERQLCLLLRRLHETIPDIEALGLPAVLRNVALQTRGLVLVSGARGQGKSSTLAALIDQRNRNASGSVLLFDDPPQYHHADRNCTIRRGGRAEGGSGSPGELVVLDEIRGCAAIEHALELAETHLCIAAMYTGDTSYPVDRIIEMFPAAERAHILAMLARTLRALLWQEVLPGIDPGTRVTTTGVALHSTRLAGLIGSWPQRSEEWRGVIVESRELGMQLRDWHVFELFQRGRISYETALRHADSASDVRLMMKCAEQGLPVCYS